MLYSVMKVILWPINKLIFRFEVVNRPDLDENKRLILCSNHISALDPILIAMTFRKISFMAKVELFKNKLVGGFLTRLGAIPVDRQKSDLKAIKSSLAVLKNEEVLGIFPEGTRVKAISQDNMKTGIGYLAYRGQADVLPVEIVGNYKPFRKMKVVYKEPIYIDDYKDVDKKEVYDLITKDIYRSIYDKE